MTRRLALLAAAFVLALSVPRTRAADDEPENDKDTPKWDVDDPGGPYRTLSFETDEGTWMSVDVHPDGKQLAFDLLGDIYTAPIAGGAAKLVSGGLAYDVQPRFSPDGKTISFTSDRGGGDNVWLMDADGSNRRALTDEDFRLINNGVWHHSGEWIVAKKHFTSRRSLGAGEMWMYRLDAAGKGVQLTKRKNDQQDIGEPELSPDGKHLYWSEDMSGGETFQYNKDPHGTIYVIRRLDMESGEIRNEIRRPGGAIRPQVSPDGKTLAYVRRVRGKSVLTLRDLELGTDRDLWDGLSIDQQETWAIFGPYPGFDWTPDGNAIVIWAQGKLHRVDARSGAATVIPIKAQVEQRMLETRRIDHSVTGDTFEVKVVRWPQLTADGKTAVFQALGHVYRRSLPDGAPERITTQDAEFEYAPWLAADGRTIVYTTWNDAEGGRVKSVAIDGSGARTLVDWPGHYASAALSPDGNEVVFHRASADGYRGAAFAHESGIYRQKIQAGAAPRLLVRGGRKPRFARDGRRITFIGRDGEKSALISIDRIGSDRRIVATSEHATDFVVSPDAKWIAFQELWQTYVAPLPASPATLELGPKSKAVPVRRLSYPGGAYLSWSSDSSNVRWSLGPDIFDTAVADAYASEPEKDARGVGASPVRLGFPAPADAPEAVVAFRHATVLPMHDLSRIDDATVVVRGNRIDAVGPEGEVTIPAGATEIDCAGQVLMPGLVDVHSHTGSSSHGIQSQQNWAFIAMLAFGVTTSHDPSNNTEGIYAESELVRAGHRIGPRILSTGTILYGAEGDFNAVVDSYEDALQEVARTTAWGPVSVKSYNQPRRDQRQQVLKAAAELGIMVVPEGGSTLHYNMTHALDGHTTLEHAVPVAPLYEPELRLIVESGTAYTPTLVVGYGGLMGENYWYAKTRVWENERLLRFVPRSVVDPNARRRTLATDESDYHHIRLAETCADVVRRGGNVEIGAHGQLQGLAAHWETWMLQQGGLTPHEALRCASYMGAKAICLDHELGSVQPGMLADLIVMDAAVLDDMQASERISHVMVNGRLYDAETMEQIAPERRKLPRGPALDQIRGDTVHAHCRCGR